MQDSTFTEGVVVPAPKKMVARGTRNPAYDPPFHVVVPAEDGTELHGFGHTWEAAELDAITNGRATETRRRVMAKAHLLLSGGTLP